MWQGGPTKAAVILGKSSAYVRGDAVSSRTVLEVKARIACMFNVAF